MKTVRTYLKGCDWCNATGIVPNPKLGFTSAITITCPVCNGAKTTLVTEIIETAEPEITDEVIDQYPDTEADGYVFCGKCGKMK